MNQVNRMDKPPIEVLKSEGILEEENYETIYMTEEETNEFMRKYTLENPDVEVETRYLKPVEPWLIKQEIQVRWLVPEEAEETQNVTPKAQRTRQQSKKL